MPQYDLIVPSGEAVLVDRATGVRLRLSAESGPLRLGSVTLDFAVEPKGLNASSGQPGEAAGAQTAPLSVPTVSQDYGQTALVRRRDDVERETEFLREIEADPLDIDDLKTELSKIDQQFSAVSKRFSDWERLQKRIDEEHAADTF